MHTAPSELSANIVSALLRLGDRVAALTRPIWPSSKTWNPEKQETFVDESAALFEVRRRHEPHGVHDER
jgi:hypothetical protein